MTYVFDPTTNTLIDDEDKSLGNKLALNQDEFLKLLEIPGVFRASEAPQPPPRPDVQDIDAINRFMRDNPVEKAEGGSIRQNFFAAGLAVPLAPALSYPASYGLATLFGLSTAGGAKILGDRVTNHIKENPEILNDPRFKAAALTFGINLPGYIAPDADEMEREAEKIRELTKPTGFPAETENMPIKTGETTPPKIETGETFPAGENIKPVVEGFPADTEQLPIIFENKKTDLNDLQKDFDDKSWRDTTVITGSPVKGTRKSVGQKTNVPFFKKLDKYSKDYHDGNLKSAIKEIGNIKIKTGERNNKLESLYTTIQNAAKRSDFKFDTSSDKLTSNILQSKVPLKFTDLTDRLRTDSSIIDNRIKELKVDKNKVYNRIELQDILGLNRSNKRQNNFFFEVLKDQGLKFENLPGGKVGFKLNDVTTALNDYAKNKLRNYESRKYASNLKKKSSENYELRSKVDGKDFTALNNQINKSINKTLGKNDLYFPDSVAQIGHNPVPVTFYEKIEMFKDKKLADKVFNIQNYTWQGKEINYDTLAKTSGKLDSAFRKLNKFYDKKITEKNISTVEEAADEVREYFNSAIESASGVAEKLPFHKDVIGQIVVSVPEIGDKLTADNFTVDMSNVDPRFIIGNVDLINPNAVKYKDLSKEEKAAYGQNIIDQKSEQLKEFYGPKGADYPLEIIEDLIEQFKLGDAEALGALERKGLGFKSGGGVEITPLPRTNFGNGGAAGADENFAAELEYFLTNEDAELPQLSTYSEPNNPIEILNDVIDPRNYPYYADVLARSGVRIGEFATRILPATGKLINDLITKPAFKIERPSEGVSKKSNYVQDYTDVLPVNIKGTGIFSEFLKNITPTSFEKKIGLDKLIEKEEQKQKDRGSTVGPKVFADTVGLGAEVTAPIFPGVKVAQKILKPKKIAAAVENRKTDASEIPKLDSIENLELNLAILKSKAKEPEGPVTEVTRALVTRLLDKKGIQYGDNDPVEIYMDIYGDIIIDVKNLAEEIIEGINQGRNFKSIDELLRIEGLDDIPIPKDPNPGIPTEDVIEMLEKDLRKKKQLNAKGGIIK